MMNTIFWLWYTPLAASLLFFGLAVCEWIDDEEPGEDAKKELLLFLVICFIPVVNIAMLGYFLYRMFIGGDTEEND